MRICGIVCSPRINGNQRMHLAGGVMAYRSEKGDVLADADGLRQAHALGKAMVRLLAKLS